MKGGRANRDLYQTQFTSGFIYIVPVHRRKRKARLKGDGHVREQGKERKKERKKEREGTH